MQLRNSDRITELALQKLNKKTKNVVSSRSEIGDNSHV